MRKLLLCFVISSLLITIPLVANEPQQMLLSQNNVLSSESGRYVFGQISENRKDQFMLDTVTGRLWRKVEGGDGSLALKIVHYKARDGGQYVVPGVTLRELKIAPAKQ